MIASEERARELGAEPLGAFVGSAVAGVDPRVMGIGPVPAVRKLLERTGIGVDDLDLVELNEAFASQSLVVIRELGLDPERVNVNGGAIAIGHPLGMSGARLVTTLLHELKRRKGRYGLATLCVGCRAGTGRSLRALVSGTAEEYLRLALRLGKHLDQLVDSYYGPPEIAEQVEAEDARDPAGLAEDAARIREGADSPWFAAQLTALEAAARKLAGEEISYQDEIERYYGIPAEWIPEERFEEAHRKLDEALPGNGSLAERYQAWREGDTLSGEPLARVVESLAAEVRRRTGCRITTVPGSIGKSVSDKPGGAVSPSKTRTGPAGRGGWTAHRLCLPRGCGGVVLVGDQERPRRRRGLVKAPLGVGGASHVDGGRPRRRGVQSMARGEVGTAGRDECPRLRQRPELERHLGDDAEGAEGAGVELHQVVAGHVLDDAAARP